MLRWMSRHFKIRTKFYLLCGFFLSGYAVCGSLTYSMLAGDAAAQELARVATELQTAANQFKVDGEGQNSIPVTRMKECGPRTMPKHQARQRLAGATLHAL